MPETPKRRSDDSLEPHHEHGSLVGYKVRLRYGKGLRGRFLITLTDPAAAEARRVRLQELSAMLARVGNHAEAPIVLKHAAAAPTERDFNEMIKLAEKRCGDAVNAKARAKRAPATFADVGGRWTRGELAADYPDHVETKKTSAQDAGRLKFIYSVPVAPGLKFGAVPIGAMKLAHAEMVMAGLPKRAKRPATRRHYAQLIHRVLELAVYPCKLIEASPLPKGFMPKIGKPPGFSYLYPDEDAALLGCQKPEVPLCYRVLWGFLDREGPRSGEAVQMRLGYELDLKRGVCSLDKNKTDDPRSWAMDQAVVRALAAYVELRGLKKGDLLFVDDDGASLSSEDKLAELLRAHLLAADVDRDELHNTTENRSRFRVHDLRGTFVTLSLANGRTETWVADRTGHQSSNMINRYRRAARSAAELGLGPLLPLDEAIPELAATVAAKGGPKGGPKAPIGRRNPVGRRRRIQRNSRAVAPPRVELGRSFERRILNRTSPDLDAQPSEETDASCKLVSSDMHGGPPEPPRVGNADAVNLSETGNGEGGGAEQLDPIEEALAEGLREAAAAGRWSAVEALTAELRARREARNHVVSLDAERSRRGRR